MRKKRRINEGWMCVADLKERGWTNSMILQILGEEDTTYPNPVRHSASPMRLYDIKRVLRAEKTLPEFANKF